MEKLEIELAYYDATAQHFNHFVTSTPLYGIKYSYLILIICRELYAIKKGITIYWKQLSL